MMEMNQDDGNDEDAEDNGDDRDTHRAHGGRPSLCAARRCCAPGTHSVPRHPAPRRRNAASPPGPPPAAAASLQRHSPASPPRPQTQCRCPPRPRQHLPSHSRVGVGLPVPTQRNSAGCPGATLSCAGSTAAVGAAAVAAVVICGGGAQGSPGPPHGAVGAVGSGGGVAQPVGGARCSPGVQRVRGERGDPPETPCGDLPGLCPSMNSTGP